MGEPTVQPRRDGNVTQLGQLPETPTRGTADPAFKPLPGGLGAECATFDVSRAMSDVARSRILAAFLEHRLLIFRNQSLSPDEIRGFAATFGQVEGNIFRKADGSVLEDVHQISNLGADGLPAEDSYIKSNYHWHTDKSYLPVPALLTMLLALELPPVGGDTQFADMTRAYESLAEDTKRQIAGLKRCTVSTTCGAARATAP